MKIEGSIQEIKDFIKEFQSKDTPLTKQQINQVKELINNAPELTEAQLEQINKYLGKEFKYER